MRSVLIEGFVIGVVAAVIGLFVGLVLARGLEALFNALGASLPHASMVLKPRTVILSLAVGIIVTVVATVSRPAARPGSPPWPPFRRARRFQHDWGRATR